MGAALACLGITGNKIRDRKDKQKRAAQISDAYDPQKYSNPTTDTRAQQSARAQVVSAERAADTVRQREEEDTPGTGQAVRGLVREEPVPIATTSSDPPPPTATNKMASDEDYMAFLDKANQDPNEGTAKTQGKGKVELKATEKGVTVPPCLKKATKEAFYTSDADEPFVPVALKWEGKGLPDETAFAKLVNHPEPTEAGVQIMDIGEWDTQGQYKELVDAVREAGKGSDVRVYRIERDGSRVEYWVVTHEGGKLVGVKALAIES